MSQHNLPKIEIHHGVLIRVNRLGVLIIGDAGSGKSSLALELLHQRHQLIADDIVEFKQCKQSILGTCPPLLKGYLHQREIGLINVSEVFGSSAIKTSCTLNMVAHLDPAFQPDSDLQTTVGHYHVLNKAFPKLTLNPNNPAQLSYRLTTWLAMRHQNTANTFQRQQQKMLRGQTTS